MPHYITPAQDHVHVSSAATAPARLAADPLSLSSFVAVLFLDALQRMFRVAQEGELLSEIRREDDK